MELSPWSGSISDALERGRLLGVRVDVVGADTGKEFLEQSDGLSRYPSVLQFSRFLYHLNLIYEVSRLALDPQYRRFRFPKLQYRPTINRLRPLDRMMLFRISLNSPWQLSSSFVYDVARMGAGALGALWLFVQSLDKLSTIPLNRRKLRAEIEKIELESAKLRNEISPMLSVQQIAQTSDESGSRPKNERSTQKRDYASDTSEDLVLPPSESSRLFNLLRRRGADKFYDDNTQAVRNLGFKIEEITLTIVDHSQGKKF